MKHAGWKFVAAVGMCLSGSCAVAQPVGCGTANQFACVNSPTDIGGSFCLRGPNRDPQFVRAVHNPDTWVIPTQQPSPHHVTIGKIEVPTGSPCAAAAPGDLHEHDEVLITKASNGNYYLDLVSKTGVHYFKSPLQLSAPQPDALWLVASTNDSDVNKRFDYFVMIGDANEGNPSVPDTAKIEKYYRVELFPSLDNPGNTSACYAERPDFLLIGIPSLHVPTLTNYTRWSAVPPNERCDGKSTRDPPRTGAAVHAHEIISSGGGEHPPG